MVLGGPHSAIVVYMTLLVLQQLGMKPRDEKGCFTVE